MKKIAMIAIVICLTVFFTATMAQSDSSHQKATDVIRPRQLEQFCR